MTVRLGRLTAALAITGLVLAACGGGGRSTDATGAAGPRLSGTIKIDGSSTVFPISEAMAEEFGKQHRDVKVTVGISGTGGGFKKFCAGEIDISDASRPIRDAEKAECEKAAIRYVELQVAIDGLSVVANPQATWVDCLTTAELKAIWDQGSTIKSWRDVRAGFPDTELKLYGPGTDSGTFDYFTEAINGKEKQSRKDFTASEDDNVLVQGVTGNRGALGYFGYAYYLNNKTKLKLVKVDAGKGCIEPNDATVKDFSYKLARPIFIYPRVDSLRRPEVFEFVRWYLGTESRTLIGQVGYLPAPDDIYGDGMKKVEAAK